MGKGGVHSPLNERHTPQSDEHSAGSGSVGAGPGRLGQINGTIDVKLEEVRERALNNVIASYQCNSAKQPSVEPVVNIT